MRKLFFLLLFIPALCIGQGRFPFASTAHLGGEVENFGGKLTDGDFASDADWTFNTPWSFSANSALYTDNVGSASLIQDSIDMVSEIDSLTNYRLEFDITSTGSAGISIYGTNSNTYVGPQLYVDGGYVRFWKTDDDWQGGGLTIYASSTSTTADFTIDNIVLTERELGEEMITNGGFDANTDWVLGANWSISGGTANYTDGSSNDLSQTQGTMVAGIEASTYYRISFTIGGSPTAANFVIESTSGQEYKVSTNYTDGTYIIDFTTPASIGDGGLYFDTSSSGTVGNFTIDNISLKKWATD